MFQFAQFFLNYPMVNIGMMKMVISSLVNRLNWWLKQNGWHMSNNLNHKIYIRNIYSSFHIFGVLLKVSVYWDCESFAEYSLPASALQIIKWTKISFSRQSELPIFDFNLDFYENINLYLYFCWRNSANKRCSKWERLLAEFLQQNMIIFVILFTKRSWRNK